MHTDPITLAELFIEGFAPTIDDLAARLGGSVYLDDIGRRCVDRDVARGLFTERAHYQAAQAAQAEQWAAELAAHQNPAIARVALIQARDAALRADGAIAADTPALAAMALADGNPDLDRRGRVFDELIAADRRGDLGYGRRFTPTQE